MTVADKVKQWLTASIVENNEQRYQRIRESKQRRIAGQ